MNVLVAYASRHGATAGIARRIADTLTVRGHPARAVEVEQVEELADAEAVVLGGASYMFHWLKPALHFAERHAEELQRVPVWLFSSGPLGPDEVDEEGVDPREAARPKEFDDLGARLHPRGEVVFFGAYDPQPSRSDSPSGSRGPCRPPRTRCRPGTSGTGTRSRPGLEGSPMSSTRSAAPSRRRADPVTPPAEPAAAARGVSAQGRSGPPAAPPAVLPGRALPRGRAG